MNGIFDYSASSKGIITDYTTGSPKFRKSHSQYNINANQRRP